MTRRLALVITAIVIATLLVAGVGTIVVGNVRARHLTRAELRTQAVEVATNLGGVFDNDATTDNPAVLRRRLNWLRVFREALDLEGLAVFTLRADGAIAGDQPPDGFDVSWLSSKRLAAGVTEVGNQGNLVWAAAPTVLPDGRVLVVVLTDQATSGLRGASETFALAALATLAIGVGVAIVLGRRLTRPIREASAVTMGIARGELSARLAAPPPDRHDELSDLARSINAMATELERARVLEQQFLLSVSHDLRTPLTSIRGYAEAISDGAADPQRSAEVIRNEARRLERLVADLLDLAKLRAKAFSLQREPVDLVALAAVACDAFRPDATERQIEIRHLSPTGAGRVVLHADHDRLAQVSANLIENALKYARTEVDVAVHADVFSAVLTVDDDGPGIAAVDVRHVFDRLYVARSTPTRQENSSGLGLAIVKELVEAMGGTCSVGSAPLGGARFEVRLPLVG